ncbi:MAG: tRNA preQ1(34) S-adenosylmethionine ribosyltransferase-isomerase QueA [Planctomycetota bacterium]|nr:tRNA preQ1(34) S-adenosylmethionine ribosyltransferase-isomerase QueA [Planctomycetota bacterium]
MRLEDLEYDLPPALIAQEPPARRGDSRLLVLPRSEGPVRHQGIADLGTLLSPGDLLVVNDTRVLAARLDARRETGGRVEVLFLEPVPGLEGVWSALLKAGGRPQPGERLEVGLDVGIRLVARGAGATWHVRPEGATAAELMATYGRMPLPPYIERKAGDERATLDERRYQTVYAATEGAVAAPTAGLHLTDAMLASLRELGVEIATVTLHVGLGTFEPVRVDDLDEHDMHVERFELPAATVEAVRRARARGGRVVAVGTTSVRALEAAAADSSDDLPRAGASTTGLLIQPGYRFRVVNSLLTNFHLPRSTLLALVFAFATRARVLDAYAEAIRSGYRFYSYGDAMLLL